jgi:hypothetical protein
VKERKNREGKIGERGRIRGKPTSIELVALLGHITREKIEEKGRRKGEKILGFVRSYHVKERREKRNRWNKRRELLFCLAFYQLSSFLD